MPHLWKEERSPENCEPEWVLRALDGEAEVRLGEASVTRGDGGALLVHSQSDSDETWLVMSAEPARVAINGNPLHAGLRALADRDEIRIHGLGRWFFSSEQLARVAPLPAADSPIFCPRCKQAIVPGSPAVRCPSCGRWYHQSDEYPCWSYSEQCLCGQPTSFETDFRWTPDGL
jgi:hypothetical protein